MCTLECHKAPARDGSSVGPQAAYNFEISLHSVNGQFFLCLLLLFVFTVFFILWLQIFWDGLVKYHCNARFHFLCTFNVKRLLYWPYTFCHPETEQERYSACNLSYWATLCDVRAPDLQRLLSFIMWRRVVWYNCASVSEEYFTSLFRLEECSI